jgi:hypothetical protein
MSETETENEAGTETTICLYPGCDKPAVATHKHGGPPPRYCENDDHNAGSTFQALKEQGAAPVAVEPAGE